MSLGWQSKALQIASKVENRTAFAFPDFRIDIFAVVIPIISASSLLFILRLTSMMSKFTFMDINYMVRSFSSFKSFPFSRALLNTSKNNPIIKRKKLTFPMADKTAANVCPLPKLPPINEIFA